MTSRSIAGESIGRSVDQIGRNPYRLGMNAVVSEKGQVTIPKAIRDRLGIRPGQVLDSRSEVV
jgi:hypothetical protein